MKARIDKKRNYLPHFFLFVLTFLVLLSILITLGRFLSPHTKTVVEEVTPKSALPTVILDAGHGGEDGGTVGINGIYEKDLNLKITLLLDEWLRAEGISTVLTRTEDILLYDKNSDHFGKKKVQDLAARRKIAEQYDNVILVSIHMNAFPDGRYSGLQVYYSPNNPSSQSLALKIQTLTHELLQPENTRKIKSAGENIYLLDRIFCPAVLIECGFLSNAQECAKLSEEAYQKKLAFCLYQSIVNYLKEDAKNLS